MVTSNIDEPIDTGADTTDEQDDQDGTAEPAPDGERTKQDRVKLDRIDPQRTKQDRT